MPGTMSERGQFNLQQRVNIALGIAALCLSLIILRLWYLQVLRGDFFREKSENNRLNTVYVPAPRGLIYDRNGKELVTNRPSVNIELVEEDAPNPKQTISTLASILGLDPATLTENPAYLRKRRRFEPRLLLKDVSRDTLAKVAARRYQLPGVIINVEPTRNYAYGPFAAHVLGYIREITRTQLDSPQFAGYRIGDLVGQFGIESRWESLLQGKHGEQRVIVNALGTRIGEFSYEPEVAGSEVTLTLDYELQRVAEEGLKDKRGAVVALDPQSGEILAMASSPAFDPNIFATEISSDRWRDLVFGPDKKLNNRVVQGGYPPGSVFKIMMAVAGLAEGVVTPNERINCPGFLHFGNRNYRCHKQSGHGSVDLKEALAQSCDVYFYTVGQRLGIDRIHEFASRFGLGRPTRLDLVEENPGLIPSTEWKRRYFKNPEDKKWYPGETLSVAIGQGAVVTTPLQIARALAALVNGGRLLRPYLVKSVAATEGEFRDDRFGPEEQGRLDVEKRILDTVREGLVAVVNDPRGTGHRAQIAERKDIVVAGKTGTAQVVSLNLSGSHEHLNDHAWFAGYAPADDPKIVVVALVENGGHGGSAAAPVVSRVMAQYFGVKPAEGESQQSVTSVED
ncbi:MAG: penicillin-binding protein 2 [Oligoflexia bacterium]|nr:penicillin-binding protein 2 [Oligoflexia bacterium]